MRWVGIHYHTATHALLRLTRMTRAIDAIPTRAAIRSNTNGLMGTSLSSASLTDGCAAAIGVAVGDTEVLVSTVVGTAVAVGRVVGTAVGVLVGMDVAVGAAAGSDVRTMTGTGVGLGEGCNVGTAIGRCVGVAVGSAVGLRVGTNVGVACGPCCTGLSVVARRFLTGPCTSEYVAVTRR